MQKEKKKRVCVCGQGGGGEKGGDGAEVARQDQPLSEGKGNHRESIETHNFSCDEQQMIIYLCARARRVCA